MNSEPPKSPLSQVAKYTHLAFALPAGTVAGLLIGAAIDKWLGTHWGYIAGLVIGMVAGFVDLGRAIMRQAKEGQ